MQQLYAKLWEINDQMIETGQKIEMIVSLLIQYTTQLQKYDKLSSIATVEDLKVLYAQYADSSYTRSAISNIDQWLQIDEERLQWFRKDLDKRWVEVRVICKPQGIRYEPNGMYHREIKTLPNKYLLISNIDIVNGSGVIITKSDMRGVWVLLQDKQVHDILESLFFELWNSNQYIVGVQACDDLCTKSRIEIMKSWNNYWIDSVINPVLYPQIMKAICYDKSTLVDFGCALNTLANQLLYWIPSQVTGLKSIPWIEKVRKKVWKIIWYEANERFVEEAMEFSSNELSDEAIQVVWKELIKNNRLPLANESVEQCVSRNFIVHLNYEDLEYNLREANRILRSWWVYTIATLNPAYEHKKYYLLTRKSLRDGQRYTHYHWNTGERWTFVQYYKTKQNLEKTFRKYFTIDSVQSCMPVDNTARELHPLYYDDSCPIALVYVLRKD